MEVDFGAEITEILNELEEGIWQYEHDYPEVPLNIALEGYRSAIKVFASTTLLFMWKKMLCEKVPQSERERLALECGEAIRSLVAQYTGINSHDLYKGEYGDNHFDKNKN